MGAVIEIPTIAGSKAPITNPKSNKGFFVFYDSENSNCLSYKTEKGIIPLEQFGLIVGGLADYTTPNEYTISQINVRSNDFPTGPIMPKNLVGGQLFGFTFVQANTGPATIKIGDFPAIPILNKSYQPLNAGDIQAFTGYLLSYGNNFFSILL